MQNGHSSAVLDEMLEPVSRCFGLETARALAGLCVTERTQARVDELAEKCNEGQLPINRRCCRWFQRPQAEAEGRKSEV